MSPGLREGEGEGRERGERERGGEREGGEMCIIKRIHGHKKPESIIITYLYNTVLLGCTSYVI